MPHRFPTGNPLRLAPHPARRGARAGGARRAGAAVEVLERRRLLSASWFVSPAGSDQNPGTIDAPFRTIQHAADVAGAGDVVDIRGGVYRETVTPADSGSPGAPITFQAYNGEDVLIDGADPLTGWSNEKGNVYQATDPTDLGFGNNQVFVNGRAMTEARWPNTTSLSHPTLASAGGGGVGTLTDDALSGSGVDWTGGVIHIASGQGWVAQTATIRSDSGDTLTFSLGASVDPHGGVTPGDGYYLTGKFQALDSPGEWFRDSDGTLYLWTPDGSSPDANAVEVKARPYGFDLSGKSNITIKGVNLFACTIVGNRSGGITLDGITAQYVSQFLTLSNGWQPANNSGVVLSGDGNSVTDSVIAYSAGDGILLLGHNNTIRNNVVHDCDHQAYDCAGIRTWGDGDTIDHNTVYNCGRDGIKFAQTTNTQVTANLVHDVMLQTSDGGAIYTFGTDGSGSQIAYNKVYNVHTFGWGGAGLYLDNNSHNFSVHNNDVTAVDIGLKMNPTSFNEKVVDNTLIAGMQSVASYGSRNMTGSQFIGNVFNNALMIGGSVKMQGNVSQGDTSGVTSAGADIGGDVPAVADASHLANPSIASAGAAPAAAPAATASAAAPAAAPNPAVAPAPLTAAQQVQADLDQLASDRLAYRDAASVEGTAAAPGAAADEALLAADQAQLKADRGRRELLKADRVRLAADRVKRRNDSAAAKAGLARDRADLRARIKADGAKLGSDRRTLRKERGSAKAGKAGKAAP